MDSDSPMDPGARGLKRASPDSPQPDAQLLDDADYVSVASPSLAPAQSPVDLGPPLLVKTIQGGAMRAVFEVLKDILHDVLLVFDSTGIKMSSLDTARTCLVYLKLHRESFEEYECRGEFRAGISVIQMFKLMKVAGSHDTVTMYMNNPVHNTTLGIRVQNADKNSRTDFHLKLMDVDHDDVEIPDAVFDSEFTIPSAYFQRLCRDMASIANEKDVVEIGSKGSKLTLRCTGDFASQETEIGETHAETAAAPTAASSAAPLASGSGSSSAAAAGCIAFTKRSEAGVPPAKFPLSMLCSFLKAYALCNTIQLNLKENFPLILRYNVASLGVLVFALASKEDD